MEVITTECDVYYDDVFIWDLQRKRPISVSHPEDLEGVRGHGISR